MARSAILTVAMNVNGDTLQQSVTQSPADGGIIDQEISVPASTTDKEISESFAFANLQSIFLLSDKDLLLETNATDATGGQAINLKAGIPFFWQKNCGITNPITANVTKIYATNAGVGGANDATLRIRALIDATP